MQQTMRSVVKWNTVLCCFLMMSFFSSSAKGQFLKFQEDTSHAIKDSETVTKYWEKRERVFMDNINKGIKMMLPILMDNVGGTNISSSCVTQAMQVVGGMQKLKTWAMRFIDSSAIIINGMITGTVSSFGAYDECVDTVAINQRSGKHKGQVMFTGKYCMLRILPSLPPKKPGYKVQDVMDELQGVAKKDTLVGKAAKYAAFLYDFPIRLGFCIPSGCSTGDIKEILAKVSNRTSVHMTVKNCQVKEELKLTPLMIFVIFMYSFAGFMVLIGTVIDVYCYYFEKKPCGTLIRFLLAFSFMSNFRKLVDTSTSSQTLSCLNGIRFLSMSWIILSHSYVMKLHQIVSGLEYVQEMVQDFPIQAIMNGFLAVDTFFFLGGLLVCYVATKNVIIAKKTFSITLYILHRLWRILPVYIFVILYVFIAETTVSGPIKYETINPFIEGCKENWWTNFLFINNFYHAADMCLPHTFYIALDMQFYIGALIILLPLFKWPKVGISIAIIFIVLSMVVCAVVSYIKGFTPTLILTNPNLEQISTFMTEFYFMPYPHCGPYVIGIISGYLLATNKIPKIPKLVQLLGWCCSTVFCMLALYGTYEWARGREPNVWETVFYSGCHRVVWTLGVAWMVICCATGHGGVVNYILSWKLWIPLGRLTFISYFTHVLVQVSFIASLRQTLHPKHYVGVWIYFGHLIVTYGVAFAGSMLIESPFLALEKLILFRNTEEKTNKGVKDPNYALDVTQVVESNKSEFLNHELVVESNKSEFLNQEPAVSQALNGVDNSAFIVYKL